MNAHHAAWPDFLQTLCAPASTTCVDIIIDQAGCTVPLLPSVQSVLPPLPWYSLFTGLPEAGADEYGPLLVRVDLSQPLQRLWLGGLMQALQGKSQLLALVSPWPFTTLAKHLSRCLEAGNGGCVGLLRYYDPRLFPLLLNSILEPQQRNAWLSPALFWSWLDLDGAPQCLPGTCGLPPAGDGFKALELTDLQVEALGCAGDAVLAVDELEANLPSDWSHEQRFKTCYRLMHVATEAGLLLQPQREAFVLENLHLAGNTSAATTGRE